jgi:hypothetical protein
MINGRRHEVNAEFALVAQKSIGFSISEYDRTHPLIIDPVMSYSTFLGGAYPDSAADLALDSSGNMIVVGVTQALNFPTVNPIQSALQGPWDGFVSKLNSTGSALIYSTYLGGSDLDTANSVSIDNSGNAYVLGSTQSANFPILNALQPIHADGGHYNDAFVTKLNANGSLVYSTYLGGVGTDVGSSIVVSGAGSAYITGFTNSLNFPTVNAAQPAHGGGNYDVFVAELNSLGSALTYSTYLGGNQDDVGNDIALDGSGNVYLTGYTFSTNFPTLGAYQSTGGPITALRLSHL